MSDEGALPQRLLAQFQASLTRRGSPAARGAGAEVTLEMLFNKAAADKVFAGKRGRVTKNPTVKALLSRFARSPADNSSVAAIMAALPVAQDGLVTFKELSAAVRKVAVCCQRPLLQPRARL